MFRPSSSTSSSERKTKQKTILIKLLIVFLFVVVFVCQAIPQYKYGYEAAMVDKVETLESTEGPRIVLVGNSSLAFGMNSELLEESLGMPVINMGLHGAQGKAFLEQVAKLDVHEGDIYVICHSELSDADSIPEPMVVWLTIENHFELWRMVRAKDWGLMLKNFPTYLKKCLTLEVSGTGNKNTGGAYSRTAFNEHGDVDYPRGLQEYTFTDASVPEPAINETCINRLNELYAYLKARGADMVVAGYPIASGEYTPDASVYEAFTQQAEEMLDCPLISDYTDYFIDYKYFYDTYLHLNSAGANLRTAQLAQDLGEYIGSYQPVSGDMIYVGDGFCQTQVDDEVNFRDAYQWNWCAQQGQLQIYSFDSEPERRTVKLYAESVTESAELKITCRDGTYIYPINNTAGTWIEFETEIEPGENTINLSCDALAPDPSNSKREVSFRLFWNDETKREPYAG